MDLCNSLRAAMLAGSAIVAFSAPAPAVAQSISFNIPPRDLDGALQQFAVLTNREILYSPALVANRRTPGVTGTFTPEQALRRLLSGADLGFQQTGPNVFVLQRGSAPRPTRTAAAMQQPSAAPGPEAPAGVAVGQGSLSGVVFDRATGTPLSGAQVAIEGTAMTAVSDARGVYRFAGLAAGDYVVLLDYLGDPPQRQSVTVAPGVPTTLDFVRGTGETAEIVVYGYTSAIQRALNEQRTAPNNSTVVSEDLLGGFPAETVSEALRRVPGVAFGRDAATGEGSRITVRGFSSEAINVQVNGVDLQGTNFERTVDLSGYLAENISKITIHKSLLPSHEATGSGGLVEIETRSGLDYGDFHFSASVEGERPIERGFGREWQGSATVGGKLTPNLGIVGTLSYRDTNRRNLDVAVSGTTPPVLPAGFTSLGTVPASRQFPFDEEFASRLITSVGYLQREREETTLAASISVAWDVADHTRLRLDLQRNERDALLSTARSTLGFIPGNFDMPIPELDGQVRRRTVLNSFRPILALTTRDQELRTDTISFRGDTDIDRWQFRYKAGYTKARSRSNNSNVDLIGGIFANLGDILDPATIQRNPDDDAAGTQRVVGGGFVELANGVFVPSLSSAGAALLFDPATYRLSTAGRSLTNSPTSAWIAEASARYAFESWLDYVEIGGKYDRSERSALDDAFATESIGTLSNINTFSAIAGRNTFLSDIDPGLLTTSGLAGRTLGGMGIPSIARNGSAAIFGALENLLADDPSTPFNEERFRFTDITGLDPVDDPNALTPARSVEEKFAGYVESHVEFGDFDIVGGARIERTRRTGTAITVPSVILNLPGVQREPRETFVEAGLVQFDDLTAIDTTITPSFLINYRPDKNIVARLGYFRSTVNPSLQLLRRQNQYSIDLRPSSGLQGARVILREGNPDLRPSTTDNWDFDVAYYFRDTPGLLRAGVFYKTISNNFTNVFVADTPSDDVQERVLEFFGPLVQSRPELFAFQPDTEFLLTRPENGEGGKIYGFELEAIRRFDFLPGFLNGFGVIGNLTYTKGDFPTLVQGRTDDGTLTNFSLDRPLEDQAAWVYNAALTYARGGFEGRLIYTHQSSTVTAYEIHDLNSVIPAYSTLDLRMSYNFNGPGGGLFTIFLEGDDLLSDANEPDIRDAISNTPGREDARFFFPNTFQFSGGRTVTVGAKVRF